MSEFIGICEHRISSQATCPECAIKLEQRIAEQDAEIKALREQVAQMPVVVGYVSTSVGADGSVPSSIGWINSYKEGKYIHPIYLDPPQEPIQP